MLEPTLGARDEWMARFEGLNRLCEQNGERAILGVEPEAFRSKVAMAEDTEEGEANPSRQI